MNALAHVGACSLAIVTFAATPAGAGDEISGRPSLAGIPSFRVVVEQLAPGIEKTAALRRDDLQAHVESRLVHAGIAVSRDAAALLYVNVAVVCNALTCAYNIALEVQQKVRVDRMPEPPPLLASTWSTGATGIAGGRAEGLRERVREQVDRFVAAYRSVNKGG